MIACRSPVEERPPSILTPRGIGYGPRSDSSAYSKETRVLRCFLPTTVIGIPIGAPSQSPEPKSAWTLPLAPIERTISSEFAATGSASTRWFHGFDFGKTGQRGADGHLEGARRRAAEQERAEAQQQDRTSHRSVIDMSKRSTKGSTLPQRSGRSSSATHRHGIAMPASMPVPDTRCVQASGVSRVGTAWNAQL